MNRYILFKILNINEVILYTENAFIKDVLKII